VGSSAATDSIGPAQALHSLQRGHEVASGRRGRLDRLRVAFDRLVLPPIASVFI
jgi:hypothetical protein